jgi:hypothetical protein
MHMLIMEVKTRRVEPKGQGWSERTGRSKRPFPSRSDRLFRFAANQKGAWRLLDVRCKTCGCRPPEMRQAFQMPRSVTTSRAIIRLLNPDTLCSSIKTHISRKRGAVTTLRHPTQARSRRVRHVFLCGPRGSNRPVASPLSVYDFGPAKTPELEGHAQYRRDARQQSRIITQAWSCLPSVGSDITYLPEMRQNRSELSRQSQEQGRRRNARRPFLPPPPFYEHSKPSTA